MLLLGDVGTGKTTLCRALLRERPAEAESVLPLNSHLSETELVGAPFAGRRRNVDVDTVKTAIPQPRGTPPLSHARWGESPAPARCPDVTQAGSVAG